MTVTTVRSRGTHRLAAPLSAIALAGAVVALYPRVAAAATFTCGATITTDVTLTSDLDCTDRPITVTGARVTVDLGGHTVRSSAPCRIPPAGCTVTFDEGSSGATLTNGHLQGASVTVHTPDVVLRSVRATNATLWLGGEGDQLVDSTTTGSTVQMARGRQVIRRNRITGGRGIHIDNLDWSISNLSIADNVVTRSTVSGIWLATYFYGGNGVTGTISGNIAEGNHDAGVSLTGNVQELGPIAITGNVASANGTDGIHVVGTAMPPAVPHVGGPVTIAGNAVHENARHGIDAGWIPGRPTGIRDGGGNVAEGNRSSPQCVGVTCG